MNTMKNFIEVLRENPDYAYDFICNEYWKMSKEELANITKELLYAIYSNSSEEEQAEIFAEVAEELKDRECC